jgi:hypothetical protein
MEETMKCVTNGKETRRVSNEEAEKLVKSGWKYTQKKKDGERFVCDLCGKRYVEKPDGICGAKRKVRERNKNGEEVVSEVRCQSKKFSKHTVPVPVY